MEVKVVVVVKWCLKSWVGSCDALNGRKNETKWTRKQKEDGVGGGAWWRWEINKTKNPT